MAATRRISTAWALAPADLVEFPVLDHPQQLGLEVQRELGDLVEEDRPAVGHLEQAGFPLGVGAGKGAGLVTEEFGLDQRLGDGGTVDLHQRLCLALAGAMDQPGEQALADP